MNGMITCRHPDSKSAVKSDQSASVSKILGAPAARVDTLVSGISGLPLRFVSPLPLHDLLNRIPPDRRGPAAEADWPFVWSLLPISGYRKSINAIDSHQVCRSSNIISGAQLTNSEHAIINLAATISCKSQKIRNEIVYSGARNATGSTHIYTPHEYIGSLFDGLVQQFAKSSVSLDPVSYAATVGYFCNALHPFLNGNGRWSRLMTIAAGRQAGSPLSGLIVSIYLTLNSDALSGNHWPRAEREGLENYISNARNFAVELEHAHRQSQDYLKFEDYFNLIKVYSGSNRSASLYFSRLVQAGSLDWTQVKSILEISTKKLAGLKYSLADLGVGEDSRISHEALLHNELLWRRAQEIAMRNL